jgi:hypothetical protein
MDDLMTGAPAWARKGGQRRTALADTRRRYHDLSNMRGDDLCTRSGPRVRRTGRGRSPRRVG